LNPASKFSLISGTAICLLVSASAQQPDRAVIERYYQEAQRALAEKRLDVAVKAYESLTRVDPNTAENYAQLGLVRYMQGSFAAAVSAFRRALQLKPTLPQVDVLLAICLSELGHYAEAEPGLVKGFQHPPDAPTKRLVGLELLRSYSRRRELDKAAQIAIKLSQLYPDDPEVLYYAGRLYGDAAYQTMQRLSQVAPDSVWVHQAAGEAHEVQGHYELAIVEYQKVLALDAARPGIHFRLGRSILLRADTASHPESLREFEKELQIDPTNVGAAYEMAEIYRKEGQLEKARAIFAVAVERQPDFEEARIGLSRSLIELQEPGKALPHLTAAIRLNAENEVSHYQLARAYQALGKTAEQQKELQEFRRLRARKRQPPSNPDEVTRQTVE
jgi:tetratricopeptide (TPR) repeat protein